VSSPALSTSGSAWVTSHAFTWAQARPSPVFDSMSKRSWSGSTHAGQKVEQHAYRKVIEGLYCQRHNRIIVVQHSKSGRKRMIPLDDTVHETLKKLTSRFAKGVVFPSSRNGTDALTIRTRRLPGSQTRWS